MNSSAQDSATSPGAPCYRAWAPSLAWVCRGASLNWAKQISVSAATSAFCFCRSAMSRASPPVTTQSRPKPRITAMPTAAAKPHVAAQINPGIRDAGVTEVVADGPPELRRLLEPGRCPATEARGELRPGSQTNSHRRDLLRVAKEARGTEWALGQRKNRSERASFDRTPEPFPAVHMNHVAQHPLNHAVSLPILRRTRRQERAETEGHDVDGRATAEHHLGHGVSDRMCQPLSAKLTPCDDDWAPPIIRTPTTLHTIATPYFSASFMSSDAQASASSPFGSVLPGIVAQPCSSTRSPRSQELWSSRAASWVV